MSGAAQLWGAAGAHTLVALVSYDDSVAPRQRKAGDASDSEAPRADDATHGAAGSSDLPTGEAEREGLTRMSPTAPNNAVLANSSASVSVSLTTGVPANSYVSERRNGAR